MFYPDCVVPSIQKKNYGDRFNELFIIKRAKTLEKFLNNVLMDPILRNSSLLYDFLTLEKETAFSNKKNSIKKSDAPTVIENFVTLDGKAKLEFLSLRNNSLRNIDFITELPNLFYLDLYQNAIEDFSDAVVQVKSVSSEIAQSS